MASCPNCATKLPEGKFKCIDCGVYAMVEADNESVELNPAVSFKLSTAEPSDYERGKTGLIDECLGGGIVDTSTVLIAGSPGAGKSTLSLAIAKALISSGQGYSPTLYVAAEEAAGDIRARAIRIGLDTATQDNIHMIDALGGLPDVGCDTLISTMQALLDATQPGLIIVDSLQGLVGKDYATQELFCKSLKTYAKEYQCPSLILCHFNKDDDFAGERALEHAVDCTLTFTGDRKRPERLMTAVKNRFGATPVYQGFIHTATGLQRVTPVTSL